MSVRYKEWKQATLSESFLASWMKTVGVKGV